MKGSKTSYAQPGRTSPRSPPQRVTLPGIDIDACCRVAAELGVDFRAREYNEVG